MLTEYYFAVRYGDIIILLYHEDMMSVWELLFKNSQKEKTTGEHMLLQNCGD